LLYIVDGVWDTWSDWAECSVTCGGGSQTRTRDCQGPFYSGAECSGDSSQIQDCNTQNCPGRLYVVKTTFWHFLLGFGLVINTPGTTTTIIIKTMMMIIIQ